MRYRSILYSYGAVTLLIALFTFSSCRKKSIKKSLRHSGFDPIQSSSKFEGAHRKGSEFSLLLGQAQHLDIPIPVTFSLISTSTEKIQEKTRDLFKYTGSLPVKKTIEFYSREMERSGWDIANLSINDKGFLYCRKPTKLCGIMIQSEATRSHKDNTEISLFITQK